MNRSGNLIIQTLAKEKANTRFQGDLLDATGRSSVAISTSIITEQEARKPAQIPEEFAVPDTFAQHLHFLGIFMLNHKWSFASPMVMWPQASSPGGTKCKEDGERYCQCSNFTWTNWAVVSFWVILCPLGNKINKKRGWLFPGKPNTWVKAENKSHVVIYVFEAYLVLFKDTIKMVTLHLTFKRVLNLGLNLVLWTFQPSVVHSLTAACLGSRAQMHYHSFWKRIHFLSLLFKKISTACLAKASVGQPVSPSHGISLLLSFANAKSPAGQDFLLAEDDLCLKCSVRFLVSPTPTLDSM